MLNFGKKKFLGIDIGASAIKMAEIELKKDKAYLANYAWMPLVDASGQGVNFNEYFYEIQLPQYLKRMVKESGCGTKNAYMSIPAYEGLLTLIEFPRLPAKDMEQAIKYEAHKYIPTSLDDVVLSWELLDDPVGAKNESGSDSDKNSGQADTDNSRNDDKVEVLLVAASKNQIILHEKAAKKAGLELRGIEIENFAMKHSLIGNDKGKFIIVDIGFHICNILYVEKGNIRINMNLDAGGEDITSTLMKSMGLARERAEKLKLSGKSLFDRKADMRVPMLETVSSEIGRVLEMIVSAPGNAQPVDAIILSGGTAGLQGLSGYLQSRFNIKTIIGNPFGRVAHDNKLEPVLDKLKNRFAVALGLALIGAENKHEDK